MTASEATRIKRLLAEKLEADGLDFVGVATGPRGTLKVTLESGSEDREKIPSEFEGRGVLVTFLDRMTRPEFGYSPALPEVAHRVRKSEQRGSGWVVSWMCERGRGKVYGAVLMSTIPEGMTLCEECFK